MDAVAGEVETVAGAVETVAGAEAGIKEVVAEVVEVGAEVVVVGRAGLKDVEDVAGQGQREKETILDSPLNLIWHLSDFSSGSRNWISF